MFLVEETDAAGVTRTLSGLVRHAAVGGVVLSVSAVAAAVHMNLASASVINLLLVLLVAWRFGLLTATISSLVAVGCLNYLFVPPVHTFAVDNPQNWISLAAFEASALMVSRLSSTARRQMWIARQQRHDSERLYEASRQVLVLDRHRAAGPQMVQLIQRVFHPDFVALFDAELARIDASADTPCDVEAETRGAYFRDRNGYDEPGRIWYRVLRMGAKPTGALALKGREITEAAADGLASLTAIALERTRAFETESRAIAERHAQQLRSAVLDALAHDFKTPLTTIRTVSGGLLETTALSPDQRDLLSLVDDQCVRLNEITTRILQTARLDSSEMVLRRRSTSLRDLTGSLLKTGADRLTGREVRVELSDGEEFTSVDRDLMVLALIQVLDNAAKYSTPSTAITLRGWAKAGEVYISIANYGTEIPPAENRRIFDRFFRLPATSHRAPGTGLGLHVTRSIVEAHHGRVWAESSSQVTTFTIALPREEESSL